MFRPLSEHIEEELDKAFCKKYNVYGTYEKSDLWENYKMKFAKFLIEEFIKEDPPQEQYKGWSK